MQNNKKPTRKKYNECEIDKKNYKKIDSYIKFFCE